MSEKNTFLDSYKPLYETLKEAFEAGDVAMLACFDHTTQQPIAVLAAVNRPVTEDGTYDFLPLARVLLPEDVEHITPPMPSETILTTLKPDMH